MKISRVDLLKALNIAKPALSAKEIVHEFIHFWFTGESILAFNDQIGIEVPFECEFQGGLLGKLLLGVLDKSKVKEITLEPGNKNGEMLLKAGNAKVIFALLDPERMIWEFPKFNAKKAFTIDSEFTGVLSQMLICTGQNTSMPDQLGVTFQCYEGKDLGDPEYLDLYSTDGRALAWSRLELPDGYDAERCTICEEFCRQLVTLTKKKGELLIEDDCALAIVDDDVKLYGRLVDVPRPLDFETDVDNAIPDPEKFVALPQRFAEKIDRVSVVLEHQPGTAAEISIDRESVLRLFAKADKSEIRDSLRLEGDHEEVTVWIDPVLIKRATDGRTEFCVTQEGLILRGPENYYHFIEAQS